MSISFVSRGQPVCINCGAPAQEKHHVVPRSLGGLATVYLCSTCHGDAHEIHRAANHKELVRAGLARAKAQGKIAGRKDALSVVAAKRGMSADALHEEIKGKLAAGSTARGLAKEYGVSHPTISKAAAD